MSNETSNNKMWAVVELLGHQRMAGMVERVPMAGTEMLLIHVPETTKQPAWSRYVGGSAVYAINPCDEAIAKAVAESIGAAPITMYELREVVKKQGSVIVNEEFWNLLREKYPTQIGEATQLMLEKKEDQDDDLFPEDEA